MNISANFKVIPLAGTMNLSDLGDGISGSSVHRVYCLTPGNVTIEAVGGGSFLFTAVAANEYIDVVVRSLVVNAGSFIGFKAHFSPHQFGPFN